MVSLGIMINRIVVSNIRFPEDEWIQLKSAAFSMGMSVNKYMRYLFYADTVRSITGVKKNKARPRGYEALEELIALASKSKCKPMGASEEDKIIYGID